jgi:hypothetical protein
VHNSTDTQSLSGVLDSNATTGPGISWPGFHVWFACLLLILLVWGFWPSYYGPMINGTLIISPLLHVHGIIGTAWVLFFLLQTVWIARGHRSVHMAMGWIGALLAASMVLMGLLLACLIYDTAINHRLHPASAWGLLLIVASQVARALIRRPGHPQCAPPVA